MKTKNLPELTDERMFPLRFKCQEIDEEMVMAHWLTIAGQLFSTPDILSEKDKENTRTITIHCIKLD